MNKTAAEIIAGVIPVKMARNRWRGILRYGLRRGRRLRRLLRESEGVEPATRLAVCAIAKDEGPYFKEWIEWHRSIGVDRFYIYDNDSRDDTLGVLRPYIEAGIVEYHPFPGYRRQIAAYDDCLERHRLDTRRIAFIDLDEFIIPVRDKTLPEFLARYEDAPVVEINWLVYGSGGAVKKEPGGVMERFRRHSLPGHRLNRHVKSIVDPRRVYAMIGCHEAARIDGRGVDSGGNNITRSWRDREPQHDLIRINHYAVRSLEEFRDKQERGRASGKKRTVPDEYFREYDLNDLPDT